MARFERSRERKAKEVLGVEGLLKTVLREEAEEILTDLAVTAEIGVILR